MAQTNADGSIILSTTIDTSGIKKGLDQVKQKTKETTKTQQDQEKTTQKQTNAYEQLKKKVQKQTAALSKMKAEYANIILTEGKTSEAAQALSSKMGTLSGILEENKAKLAGVEQEANDLVSSFSKFGNEAQESAKKPKNAYQQLEETIAGQKTRLEELRQEYASLKLTNQGNTTQAKKLKAEINNLSAEVTENEARIKSLGLTSSSAFAQMKSRLMALASYFIGIQTIFAAFRFSGESAEFATQTEASVQRLVDIYGSASDSVGDFIDANARALGMSKAAAASFSSVYGNLFSVWADQATNAELTNRYLNMTAVVASKTGRTVEDVQERVRSGLLGNTEAIEDLGIFVNVKTIEMTDAFQRMANGKSWEQLDAYTQQQIRSMAILEQATAKYGDEVADTSATIRNRFNAAYEDFKNTWGQFINTVLLPILEVLTQVFDIATKGMNALMGKSGKTLENVELQEENTNKTAKNIEEQTDNQKALNKEMKKTLAGFDEIQILSSQTSEASTEAEGQGGQPIEIPTMPLETGEDVQKKVDEKLAAIIAGAGVALAALGIILLCFGQIGWGIGLLIAGISIFAVSRASLNDEINKKTKEKLDAIVAIASAALLALGIILLFTPASLPLAIGLIIVGAAGLATEVALNWDFVKEKAEYIFSEFGAIVAAAGTALIVLGIILCCTGVGVGIGIGLIVAGAAGLAGAIAVNWDAIVDWVKGAWEAVKDFWNRYIAPVFTAKFWLDLAKKCGNGLINGFESAINGIIGMFEKMINWIINGLNKISFDIPDWLGGGSFGINIPNVSFGRVSIPRLAQGAVIPPNREFLAVLGDQKQGTNIEAPLSTIQEAVSSVISAQNGEIQETLREILEAILGIQIGDETIGRASQRYNNSILKIHGGVI